MSRDEERKSVKKKCELKESIAGHTEGSACLWTCVMRDGFRIQTELHACVSRKGNRYITHFFPSEIFEREADVTTQFPHLSFSQPVFWLGCYHGYHWKKAWISQSGSVRNCIIREGDALFFFIPCHNLKGWKWSVQELESGKREENEKKEKSLCQKGCTGCDSLPSLKTRGNDFCPENPSANDRLVKMSGRHVRRLIIRSLLSHEEKGFYSLTVRRRLLDIQCLHVKQSFDEESKRGGEQNFALLLHLRLLRLSRLSLSLKV